MSGIEFDHGPVETAQHGPLVVENGTARRRWASVLDLYRSRRQLDPADPALNRLRFEAGECLARDVHAAGFEPRVTAAYRESLGHTDGPPRDWTDRIRTDAWRRYRRAVAALSESERRVVWQAVLLDEPVGRRAMPELRRGLDALARCYGLVGGRGAA